MKKASLLKITNPILAIVAIVQFASAIGMTLLNGQNLYETVRQIHAVNGFAFFALIILHIALNWTWFRTNFFKSTRTKTPAQ
jgi:hypothetical protein